MSTFAFKKFIWRSLSALVFGGCCFANSVYAFVLTPVGAEQGANLDGSIPAWNGGLTEPPAGFDPQLGFADPFPDDKPLFVIDQSNLSQHKAFLSEGQQALIQRYSNYVIPVYQSRRTAAFSADMIQAVKQERGQVKLTPSGNGLIGVANSMVPFVEPKNGLEIVWNTILRRPSQSLSSATASFIAGSGITPVPFSSEQIIAWAPAIGKAGGTKLFSLIGESIRPAAQAGEARLVEETLNFDEDTRNAWMVNSGQRRIIRAPELVHSAPAGNSDALKTVDDIYGFNGSPERYDWRLLGKREMYIPYNNYKMTDKSLSYQSMVDGAFIRSELIRFEKHRVWVVEGTLKPGMEHIYSRRIMYVDEDSWYVALMDQFDSKGALWRVKALYLMQAYNAPGMYTAGEMQHDLNARKTIFSGFQNEERPTEFNIRVSASDFSQSALRRRMR
jgi:hypothetical protein